MNALPLRRIGSSGLRVSTLGFGAAPLGNLYSAVTDAEARRTAIAAIDAGITYIDTAPYYGFGLSERRVGEVLHGRSGVVLSTKVGRLLVPGPTPGVSAVRDGFDSPMPFEAVFDYSFDGVMSSWAASRERLRLDSIDILYVHDAGRLTHGDGHAAVMHELVEKGGLRALEELRAAGSIKAFGVGVNEIEVCLEIMGHAHLDVILLAGRYTLLEQGALRQLFPACARNGTSLVIGGPYNSGILATGTRGGGPLHYNYRKAPGAVVDRVRRLEAHCDRHGVPLAAVALQFPLAHPAVASVIPGLGNTAQISLTLELYTTRIPDGLWWDLKNDGLLDADAPVPTAATGDRR